MLIPIKQNQITKLIPSVGTGSQFKYALGEPRKVLQRLIISSIGGILNLLLFISQSSTQTENLWLLLCVVFFLYILWGPILESSRKNSSYKKSKFFSSLMVIFLIFIKLKKLKVHVNNQIGKVV